MKKGVMFIIFGLIFLTTFFCIEEPPPPIDVIIEEVSYSLLENVSPTFKAIINWKTLSKATSYDILFDEDQNQFQTHDSVLI
jgi:hypothetical protein